MSDLGLKKIKVIIVDDSITMQRFIQQLVADDSDLEIVATATDPYIARDLIKTHNPDVLILDIEMPRMDGLTFLANLMRLRPMPVVMNSSLSQKGAYETIKALEIGAVDYIGKPQSADILDEYKVELVKKVKRAAKIDVARYRNETRDAPQLISKSDVIDTSPVKEIIAIGASTGGIEALSTVIRQMPSKVPPILIVQHIPPNFSSAFAQRLDETSQIHVVEASNAQKICNGVAYIAPGGMQMSLTLRGADYYIVIQDTPPVSGHKPSVDALFSSIASIKKIKCKAALLTGMGSDGAHGLKCLYHLGLGTVVQDKESSVVWGMPKSAIDLEPGHSMLPLKDIAQFLIG